MMEIIYFSLYHIQQDIRAEKYSAFGKTSTVEVSVATSSIDDN